jgi:hypothetical protein
MKRFAIAEIFLGLLLAAASSYIMVSSTFDRRSDPHGLVLGLALFGAAVGALLAFAGSSLLANSRFRSLGHIPFFAFLVVTWVVWGGAYA